MIRYFNSETNVVACSIAGGISREELIELFSRIERSLETNEKTHLFVEIDGLTGIDARAWAEHMPRGLAMVSKLKRFGRIAVVSNDRLVRWATRIESALLPYVRYEIFTSGEREQALAWVEGRSEMAHQRSLTIISTDSDAVLAFEIDGTVTNRDIDFAMAKVAPQLANSSGPLNFLARIGQLGIGDLTPFLNSKYLQFKLDALRRAGRYAVVGGPAWLRLWVNATAPLLSFELRHFFATDEAAAWQWVGAKARKHPLAATAEPETV